MYMENAVNECNMRSAKLASGMVIWLKGGRLYILYMASHADANLPCLLSIAIFDMHRCSRVGVLSSVFIVRMHAYIAYLLEPFISVYL